MFRLNCVSTNAVAVLRALGVVKEKHRSLIDGTYNVLLDEDIEVHVNSTELKVINSQGNYVYINRNDYSLFLEG